MILVGIVSFFMGGTWSIFPVVFGFGLLVFWAVAMRGKSDSKTVSDTRSLPGDETVSGTHKATGYAHEGQAPGHQSG